MKFLFSIVDNHGPVRWHDIPIPPGRTAKACKEMLYRLKKRVDAGEGGLPKTKAPRKRKAQTKGKTEIDSKSCDSTIAHVKLENGNRASEDDVDNDDRDLGSPKLKRKRASPKLNRPSKADSKGSDGDNDVAAIVKGEFDEEEEEKDDDVKLGALDSF